MSLLQGTLHMEIQYITKQEIKFIVEESEVVSASNISGVHMLQTLPFKQCDVLVSQDNVLRQPTEQVC